MPVPTAYTESQLANYMHTVLGGVASAMGYAAPGAGVGGYAEPVTETLIAYGVTDIADATDIQKLRTLARREAWRKVMDETTGHYDFTSDDQSFKRSQLHTQAVQAFEQAGSEAARYAEDDTTVEVGVVDLVYTNESDT